MVRAAIVEDDSVFAEKIREILAEEEKKEGYGLMVEIYHSAQTLLYEMEKKKFEIYFLDIEMQGMDGLTLARKIRAEQWGMDIIFVTSHEKYALEGYDVAAFQYILKSKMEEKLPRVLKDLFYIKHEKEEQYYEIRTELRYERFMIKEIFYIYKEKKYAVFVTERGEFRERKALKTVMERLPRERFLLVERGRIVNLRYVERFCGDELKMRNQEWIAVGRSYVSEVKRELIRYWGGENAG